MLNLSRQRGGGGGGVGGGGGGGWSGGLNDSIRDVLRHSLSDVKRPF